MAELLEDIKKLPREEQLALADQIYELDSEGQTEDEAWKAELVRRAMHAKANGFPGRSMEAVLDELERANQRAEVTAP